MTVRTRYFLESSEKILSFEFLFLYLQYYINEEKTNCIVCHGLSFVDDENVRKLKYMGTFEEFGINSEFTLTELEKPEKNMNKRETVL